MNSLTEVLLCNCAGLLIVHSQQPLVEERFSSKCRLIGQQQMPRKDKCGMWRLTPRRRLSEESPVSGPRVPRARRPKHRGDKQGERGDSRMCAIKEGFQEISGDQFQGREQNKYEQRLTPAVRHRQ